MCRRCRGCAIPSILGERGTALLKVLDKWISEFLKIDAELKRIASLASQFWRKLGNTLEILFAQHLFQFRFILRYLQAFCLHSLKMSSFL